MGACAELGIPLDVVELSKNRNGRFRKRYEQATAALTENVFSALYRAAMKGNVAAMKFWLENHTTAKFTPDVDLTGDLNSLAEMADDELAQLAKTHGLNGAD